MIRVQRYAICFSAIALSGLVHAAQPHWDYEGADGPLHWGELAAEYSACAEGELQSPIDIRGAEHRTLPPLRFETTAAAPHVLDTGHTVQVDLPADNSLTVGPAHYRLAQFHFHTPSEERIAGREYPLVAHLVFRDAQSQLAVVSLLFEQGAANEALAPLFDHLPATAGETASLDGVRFDLARLLPQQLGYYHYRGSLTTPPCTEGVDWYVLKRAAQVSPAQLAAFRAHYAHNARPLQPLHGRVVEERD